ncbi:McrC family protein [Streptomyces sp. NPDC051563]|uniref:McrC family protein n=1 Tax=Streptomyces sp. NPDC051563 TaxID=3365659 RepID=UPI003799B845
MLSLREYDRAVLPGIRLTGADRRLLADGVLDPVLRIRELAGDCLEVEARAYVGVVRLDACEIRVLPKHLGDGLDVLRMLEYAADGRIRTPEAGRRLEAGDADLRDLVALMVTEHCERLLRHGVRKDYVTRQEDLPVVRGRLLADRQVLRHHGRLDRLACRFDEHDTDVVDNRLCAAAVERAARTAGSPRVRARARRAAAQFGPLAPTPLGDLRQAVSTLSYHRHNEHYRPAHRWARLLLSGGGIDGLFATGPLASRAFFLDMNRLFEDFVTRLLGEGSAGSGLTVTGQSAQRRVLVDEATQKHYSEVRPDVLVRGVRGGVPSGCRSTRSTSCTRGRSSRRRTSTRRSSTPTRWAVRPSACWSIPPGRTPRGRASPYGTTRAPPRRASGPFRWTCGRSWPGWPGRSPWRLRPGCGARSSVSRRSRRRSSSRTPSCRSGPS